MIDYTKYIDPISVRNLAVKIVSPLANNFAWNWHQPPAIFEYVKTNIAYVPDPRGTDYIATPTETLNCGGGDCEDHAILIASLLEAVGIPARLVFCRADSGNHMLCQVNFGKQNTKAVVDDLSLFYQKRGKPNLSFSWENDSKGNMWFFSDTAMCNYFGDIDGLVNNGYIDRKNNSWKWRKKVDYFMR